MIEPFLFASAPIFTGAGGTATGNIPIYRETEFLCTAILGWSVGPFLFQVRDSGTDQLWSSAPIHSKLLPVSFPEPRKVAPASNVHLEITDYSLRRNEVRIVLLGIRFTEHQYDPKVRALDLILRETLPRVPKADWAAILANLDAPLKTIAVAYLKKAEANA